MPHEKIKSALKKLHDDLSEALLESTASDALCADEEQTQEDADLQELLATVVSDIDEYLNSSEKAAKNKHGFAHRLEEIATDFSVEHPKLDTILQEIRKILLGIGA